MELEEEEHHRRPELQEIEWLLSDRSQSGLFPIHGQEAAKILP